MLETESDPRPDVHEETMPPASLQAAPAPLPTEARPDETGLEIEKDDPSEITQPFEPERIRVRTVNVVVDQIVSRINHAEIDLAPDFQRAAEIWDVRRQSRLIESFLLRIPIPVFYVAADKDEKWSVVDGLQRMSTLHRFITGQFRLERLEYLTKMENLNYADLPRAMQRRINETQLVIHVIEPGTPDEVMFNIFKRINTGGLPLNGQEIRHAMHRGPVREYLKKLSAMDSFKIATDNSIESNRMADRECILRFLAFFIAPWEEYASKNIDGFLGQTMIKLNQISLDQYKRLAGDFERAMKAASGLFENDAFRKRYDMDAGRRPISKALFETWSVALARRSDSQIVSLCQQHSEVRKQFVELMNNDREFDVSISYSTATPARVRKRFQAIDDLVRRFLQC